MATMAEANNANELPEFRLPPHVKPHHYDLDIVTKLEQNNFIFYGSVKIKVECLQPTNEIVVHARNLKIDEKNVAVESTTKALKVVQTNIDSKNEFFKLYVFEILEAGHMYTVHLPFQGELKEDLTGYYRSSYFDRGSNTTKWLAVTHFEPIDARKAFPCFDEPGLKATFTIRLGHKKNLDSVSNMPLLKTAPMDDKPGWVWNEFQPTVPMSTYLIAYMVSEFKFREVDTVPNSHVQFRIWARHDALGQSNFAALVGPHFLQFYESFFDIKYPLPKQDLLAIPDFKISAMENWGIITFREAMLLLDEQKTSSPVKLSIANVIAHELAHMWFGNLVTINWWTDLWLKEGFATYMAGLSVHHEFPEWNSFDATALYNLLTVFKKDALLSSHPVSVPISHPNEISQVFDAISYDKGSFLLRMMSLFLGEEVFRHGVSEYLKKHQYKNAEQDDLWASLTEQAHRYHALPAEVTVKQIMDTWTLQDGYPIVTVERDYERKRVIVSQKRMLSVRSSNSADYKRSWWIPLSYSTRNDQQFNRTQPQHWFSSGKERLIFDITADYEDWFLLNNRAAGLFRVNYDGVNWDLLSHQLQTSHQEIDVLNRIQLVIDAMDFAHYGLLEYKVALQIIGYLCNETAFLPWKAGIEKLTSIRQIIVRSDKYVIFKQFLGFLLRNVVSHIGSLKKEPDSFEEAQLLNLIAPVACNSNVGNWRSQALDLFKEWCKMVDPDRNNPVPKNVRSTVYAQAAIMSEILGYEEVWKFLWGRYMNTDLSTERNHILRALAHFPQPCLLNKLLNMSLDETSGIRKQDAYLVFHLVAASEHGFFVAKDYFFSNIKKISEYFGEKENVIGKYFASIAEQSINQEHYNQLTELKNRHAELLAPGSLAISQSLETLSGNIRWVEQHNNTFSDILKDILNDDREP